MFKTMLAAMAIVTLMAAIPVRTWSQPAPTVAPPAAPMIRAERLTKVADHVWIIPDESRPLVPNVGMVVGSKAALVIDTGLGARNGAVVLAAAQKLAPGKTLYLVTTHVHPEHDLGAQAFPPSTRMIRSKAQEAEIAEGGLTLAKAFAARSPANAELLEGAAFRKADISFETEHALDLGGVTVRIWAVGPNHTRGDTTVFVEPDGVLFSGDVAMKPQPAVTPGSSLKHWLATLDRLETLRPKLMVPSHGPTGDASLIAGYRAYLTEVTTRVASLKRDGRSLEEASATVSAELAPRYPDAGRLAGAIRAAYSEAP